MRGGRRRPVHLGGWVASALDGSSGPGSKHFPPSGPDNLDIECKASLEKLLKPSNYGAISHWMRSHGRKDKLGVLKLAEAAVGDNGVPVKQDLAHAALQQPVQQNTKGRHRLSGAVHVTADRQQVDLMKVRSGSDQSDPDLLRKRKFMRDYASTPSIDSVSEFYRLADKPIASELSAKVLTEEARRGLSRWQIRGPEQNREDTAQIMQSLRSLGDSVKSLPAYSDQLRSRGVGEPVGSSLHNDASIRTAARYGSYTRQLPMMQSGQGLTRSCPTIPPSYLSHDEIKNVNRPGGYVVNLMDCEPLQMKKNKQRNITSKIVQGGATSWTTSYGTMCTGGRSRERQIIRCSKNASQLEEIVRRLRKKQ